MISGNKIYKSALILFVVKSSMLLRLSRIFLPCVIGLQDFRDAPLALDQPPDHEPVHVREEHVGVRGDGRH